MLLTALFLSIADARPVESSEFRHTGETLDKGTWSMRPLMPSGFGLTNRVELKVKSPISALVARDVSLGVEVALLDTANHDLSVTATGMIAYTQTWYGVEGRGTYTLTQGRSAFSLTGEVMVGITDDDVYPWVNLLGFYDFRANEKHGLRVRVTQRPQTWGSGVPAGSAAIGWIGGGENVRAQIGLGVAYGQDLIDISDALAAWNIDIPKVMPYPDVALWWTF